MNENEARLVAHDVDQYLQTATGDCAGEYVRMLEAGEVGDFGAPEELHQAWLRARSQVGRGFDHHGWVADRLYSDGDWCADLAGDRIGDLLSQRGMGWGTPTYEAAYNAVCDALAALRPSESSVREAFLSLRYDGSTEEVS